MRAECVRRAANISSIDVNGFCRLGEKEFHAESAEAAQRKGERMKTEVYSWRVSTDIKAGLFSAVLDLAATEWLNNGRRRFRILPAKRSPKRNDTVPALIRRPLLRSEFAEPVSRRYSAIHEKVATGDKRPVGAPSVHPLQGE